MSRELTICWRWLVLYAFYLYAVPLTILLEIVNRSARQIERQSDKTLYRLEVTEFALNIWRDWARRARHV